MEFTTTELRAIADSLQAAARFYDKLCKDMRESGQIPIAVTFAEQAHTAREIADKIENHLAA